MDRAVRDGVFRGSVQVSEIIRGQGSTACTGGRRSVRMVRNQLRQLIDAHDAEKFMDECIVAAQGNGLAAAQALHQYTDELADAAVVDPGHLGQVDQHVVMRGGIAAKLLQGAVVGRGDLAGKPQGVVYRYRKRGLDNLSSQCTARLWVARLRSCSRAIRRSTPRTWSLRLALRAARNILAHSSAPFSSTISMREKSIRTTAFLSVPAMPSRRVAAAFLSSSPVSSRLAASACGGAPVAPLFPIFCQTGGEGSKRIA